MELKDIMEAFAAEVGVTEVAPDDAGVYHLEFDGMGVSFATADDRLVTWAEVGEIPSEGCERLYRALLEAMLLGSLTKGASFAVDSETDRIFLQRLDALAALSPEGFRKMIETFVNVLETWRKVVSDFQEVAPEQARKAEAAAAEVRELDRGGFMRV